MTYRWVGPGRLRRVDGDHVEVDEVFTPSDSERETFGDRIEVVDDEEADDGDESEDDDSQSNEGESPNYAEMDYAELRQLAVDADTDEIDGRSKKAEIIEFFS